MTSALNEWADRWGVPDYVLADLRKTLWLAGESAGPAEQGGSEAAVQSQARVIASQMGMRVWRNNVGALPHPETGTPIRFGLANDSAQVNRVLKSGDLIGIRPVWIQPRHIGSTIGQFVSLECKRVGWKYAGTEREVAQENWAALVTSLGGVARFVNDPQSVRSI